MDSNPRLASHLTHAPFKRQPLNPTLLTSSLKSMRFSRSLNRRPKKTSAPPPAAPNATTTDDGRPTLSCPFSWWTKPWEAALKKHVRPATANRRRKEINIRMKMPLQVFEQITQPLNPDSHPISLVSLSRPVQPMRRAITMTCSAAGYGHPRSVRSALRSRYVISAPRVYIFRQYNM